MIFSNSSGLQALRNILRYFNLVLIYIFNWFSFIIMKLLLIICFPQPNSRKARQTRNFDKDLLYGLSRYCLDWNSRESLLSVNLQFHKVFISIEVPGENVTFLRLILFKDTSIFLQEKRNSPLWIWQVIATIFFSKYEVKTCFEEQLCPEESNKSK